jgi:hypothetical protein
MVIGWVAIFFEVVFNTMSVRNIMRIFVAFTTQNFLAASGRMLFSSGMNNSQNPDAMTAS